MTNKEHPNVESPRWAATPVTVPAKAPFVEPKLTWIEPELRQQGTLNATAQTGGFFGSFSP